MTDSITKTKKYTAILLATVLVAGIIGISSTLIAIAEEYEKEKRYDSSDTYTKDKNRHASYYDGLKCNANNFNINTVDSKSIQKELGVDAAELSTQQISELSSPRDLESIFGGGFSLYIKTISINFGDNNPPPTNLPPNGDEDGDLLLNSWETNGIDSNSDGTIDLILPNANPLHKDIYIETDFMEFHQPIQQAINDVINNFANAPLSNPDGINGITLHVDVDEQITHQDNIAGSDMVTIRNTNLGTAGERADANSANILSAKRSVYHYAIFAHGYDGGGSSGLSNGIPAMEFIVTLGVGWTPDANGHSVGSQDEQSGTFMHELGHNLGLGHGGSDGINCKPNYLSVMTYARQFSNPIGDRPLDYSRNAIPSLDETSLSEPNGIGQSEPPGLMTVYGPGPIAFTNAGNPVDWNRDTDAVDTGVNADINSINSVSGCNSASPNQILNGFDDWENIVFITTPAPGLSPFSTNQLNIMQEEEPELTSEDVQQMRLGLVDGIEQAITTALGELPQENKLSQELAVETQTQQVRDLVEAENFAQAIVELDDLENKFNLYTEEQTLTQNSSESQEKVIFLIENMKQVLQKVLPPSID